jgi:hypothetical protein
MIFETLCVMLIMLVFGAAVAFRGCRTPCTVSTATALASITL